MHIYRNNCVSIKLTVHFSGISLNFFQDKKISILRLLMYRQKRVLLFSEESISVGADSLSFSSLGKVPLMSHYFGNRMISSETKEKKYVLYCIMFKGPL